MLYTPIYNGKSWEIEEISDPLYKIVGIIYARKKDGEFYGINYSASELFTTREAAEAYIRKDYYKARQFQWDRINRNAERA